MHLVRFDQVEQRIAIQGYSSRRVTLRHQGLLLRAPLRPESVPC